MMMVTGGAGFIGSNLAMRLLDLGASVLVVDSLIPETGANPFNLEPVVRAVVRSKHPVITAIAHTGDHHLADDVADYAVGTPSLAAQLFGDQRTRFRRAALQLPQRGGNHLLCLCGQPAPVRARRERFTHIHMRGERTAA